MNRIRNFLAGTDVDAYSNQNTGRRNNHRSLSSRYGRGISDGIRAQKRQSPFSEDLYLSDDDEGWGMSAYSESEHDDGARQSSSAFWDQRLAEGTGGGDMEISSKSAGGGSDGLQEWEREAIMRDKLENTLVMVNDDHYHSDTIGPDAPKESNAYAEVQEIVRTLEGGGEEEKDDDASSASSSKEEVVNAYRDYLKSIRDGGFESYLDTTQGISEKYETPDFDGIAATSSEGRGEVCEDEALDRVVNIEEERASGSLYGELYGVHDVRSEATSPYSAWRAKAKALLQQEQERERNGVRLPSRQILNKFRRNNSSHGVEMPFQQKQGYSESGISENLYHYQLALFQNSRFRGICISICMILLLITGLSYHGWENTNKEDDRTNMTISLRANNSLKNKGIGKQAYSQNSPHPGLSDAVVNVLQTFDPTWYDRRSGWEGITYMDAVKFCAFHKGRVPCPYELYCNQAVGGPPVKGNRPNGEQWAPISNGANQWVQVGGMFTCQRYTDLHDGKKPGWGITGISLEHKHGAGGITQNILCCVDVYLIGSLDPFTEWGNLDETNHVEGDATKETFDKAVVNVKETEGEKSPNPENAVVTSHNDTDAQTREKAVIDAFQPIWFSSAHGWTGTSYEDAILFCESYNHMVLCPYAAYCPLGRGSPALPGSMTTVLDGEEWVPANGPMNTWVQIGTTSGDESTSCTLHSDLLGERPQWGIDGTRSDVKHHIMCCLM